MLVSLQSMALFLEQDMSDMSEIQKGRLQQHILTAGDMARGMLTAMYYVIPEVTRNSDGVITAPAGIANDPERTLLGVAIKNIVACKILDPSRGFQPQEDRNSASRYCTEGYKILEALASGQKFIAPLDQLAGYGITASEALKAMLTSKQIKSTPAVRQQGTGMFGTYHDPRGGSLETETPTDPDAFTWALEEW